SRGHRELFSRHGTTSAHRGIAAGDDAGCRRKPRVLSGIGRGVSGRIPRAMNEQPTPSRTERIVGIFVVVALLLLVAGFAFYLYRVAERKGWRVQRCPFYTYVQSG